MATSTKQAKPKETTADRYGRHAQSALKGALGQFLSSYKAGAFDPDHYRLRPQAYLEEKLRWIPWRGIPDHPGQVEVIEAYELALRQQLERRAYERDEVTLDQCEVWQPGTVIQNWIRVEASQAIGKTRLASGLINHFFDCFSPSITYCLAPSFAQIHDLLFKEIKSTRLAAELPGKLMDLRLEQGEDHFVVGRNTSDTGGTGIEKIQGQHSPHIMLVIDEAEGVDGFVYKAVDTMASGGVVIVLLLANPRTRTSEFYKRRTRAEVVNFRISAIYHPNVLEDKAVIPGAVSRDAVERYLRDNCVIVEKHDTDRHTFEVPWRPGVIYLPDPDAMVRLLGAPPDGTDERVIIPLGRFEEACRREPLDDDPWWARIGVDVARDGKDKGTIYVRHAGCVRRLRALRHQNSNEYAGTIKDACLELREQGVTHILVRIDGGGGYGGAVADRLAEDEDLIEAFKPPKDCKPEDADKHGIEITAIQFAGKAVDKKLYADKITELYHHAAESLKGVAIERPPKELESDLTERRWRYRNQGGRELKCLETKDEFRDRVGRSPDDGDGFVLAIAPDHIFNVEWLWA